MFYLHVSNRTENLLSQMAEVIRVDPQGHLFDPELFLIQSQGMERMIGQTLAGEFGSFCNYQFFLPLGFLEFVANCLGAAVSPDGFQRQVLTWRLDALLRDVSDELYLPLQSYLTGTNRSLKRFQLARRLANLFDQYQIMRPEMLSKWESGKNATTHFSEGWQMGLWRKLVKQSGGDGHRGNQFSNLFEQLTCGDDFSYLLPKRIAVIGLHTLPPVFLNFLNSLSPHMDVHLFLLSPCQKYWGNVESEKSKFKRMVKQNPFPIPSYDKQEVDHPILAIMGQQGRDLQNLMLEIADFTLEFSSYHDGLEKRGYQKSTLLQRLQSDLLRGSMAVGGAPPLLPGDDSIQIVSCHSKFREMTVLKDHILKILSSQPQLELRDIIVMAPDIQEYAFIIPAVFSDIQHSVADRSLRRRNSFMAAFLSFLELFNGRFGWSEVLDLLRLEVIYPKFQLSISDLDILQQWVVGAGIRWGISGDQRKEDGLAEFDETSWLAGLDSMLMGYAIDSDEDVDGILPFTDIEGRTGAALGGLCHFIEIIKKARLSLKHPCSLADWSKRLQEMVEQLFGEGFEQELLELRTQIFELAEQNSLFHTDDVDCEVIQEWFKQSAKESRSSSGFLRGQLTFCSMLPMRSIPFQVVCLIGLNDGAFPKNDSRDTFDLMAFDNRAGDRSARADDRYQFMEALLAARSNIYISYIGQSIKNNDSIPPSVVVTELLEVLESGYGATELVACHPLHPFSKKYFQETRLPGLFSYDSNYCKTAKAIEERVQGRGQVADKWWQGLLNKQNHKVSWIDFLRFYTNPQKYFICNCLGIRLDGGEDLPEDRENFHISGLEKYQIEAEMVSKGLEANLDQLCEKLQTRGVWPQGTSGKLAFDEKHQQIEDFLLQLAGLEMGERLPDVRLDLEISGQQLEGNLSGVYENGLMLVRFGKLRGRDLLSGWLHHLAACQLNLPQTTQIVATDRIVTFDENANGPDLETFLAHFTVGCTSPSLFYIEPAFEYVRQAANSRSRVSPLDKAMKTLQYRLENRYEPEWELLLGEVGVTEQDIGEFESLCLQIMSPVWEASHG